MPNNPGRRQNVTQQMAIASVLTAMVQDRTARRAFIWYDNPRDGWHWDWEGSEYLGHRENGLPRTEKLIEVK
jgi:hypothetical protein